MKIARYKYLLLAWAIAILIGSFGTQYLPLDTNGLFVLWGAVTLGGILGSSYFVIWKSATQKKIQIYWIILILAGFLINILSFYTKTFAFIASVNIYTFWSVVDAIGYFGSARESGWKKMWYCGIISLASVPLFYLDPLLAWQALVFGIIQGGLLIWATYTK